MIRLARVWRFVCDTVWASLYANWVEIALAIPADELVQVWIAKGCLPDYMGSLLWPKSQYWVRSRYFNSTYRNHTPLPLLHNRLYSNLSLSSAWSSVIVKLCILVTEPKLRVVFWHPRLNDFPGGCDMLLCMFCGPQPSFSRPSNTLLSRMNDIEVVVMGSVVICRSGFGGLFRCSKIEFASVHDVAEAMWTEWGRICNSHSRSSISMRERIRHVAMFTYLCCMCANLISFCHLNHFQAMILLLPSKFDSQEVSFALFVITF